jgi:hypothetical protein
MSETGSRRGLVFVLLGLLLIGGAAFVGWRLLRSADLLPGVGAPPAGESPRQSYGSFADGFWWTEGNDTVLVGWPKQPAHLDRPAFLVLLRFPDRTTSSQFSQHSSHSAEAWQVEMSGGVGLPDGRQFEAKYSASSKEPAEKFTANGKSYSSDAGRVFLVDLTEPSPRVTQLPTDDLKPVVRNPSGAAGASPFDPRAVLRDALRTLGDEHAPVRQFLTGSKLE